MSFLGDTAVARFRAFPALPAETKLAIAPSVVFSIPKMTPPPLLDGAGSCGLGPRNDLTKQSSRHASGESTEARFVCRGSRLVRSRRRL